MAVLLKFRSLGDKIEGKQDLILKSICLIYYLITQTVYLTILFHFVQGFPKLKSFKETEENAEFIINVSRENLAQNSFLPLMMVGLVLKHYLTILLLLF